jgi:peptidoglycan L-alanyl-D-glutamate endopeptidase CwlK
MTPLTQLQIDELLKGSRKQLDTLWKPFAVRVEELIVNVANRGYGYGLFVGERTPAVQLATYAQGRQTLDEVNALRKTAGLGPIPASENKIVTKLKFSWHNLKCAGDMVRDNDLNKVGIQWTWADNHSYFVIGEEAKKLGLEWGGFWKAFTDYPHVQLTGGLDLKTAIAIYNQGGVDAVLAEVRLRLRAQGWSFPLGT